MQKLELILETY